MADGPVLDLDRSFAFFDRVGTDPGTNAFVVQTLNTKPGQRLTVGCRLNLNDVQFMPAKYPSLGNHALLSQKRQPAGTVSRWPTLSDFALTKSPAVNGSAFGLDSGLGSSKW